LAKLLNRYRKRPSSHGRPQLTIEQILARAEAQRTLFGMLPTTNTGVLGSTGETWRGIDQALRRGTRGLANGAGWIWKAVERSLPGCLQTLDFFHACQCLSRCAERVFGEGTSAARAAYEHSRGLLVRQGWGGVCQWVSELLDVADESERERRRQATDRLVRYFSKHTNRLNYTERLQTGRPIGSGQVEGEAKTLGMRLKPRGARWNKRNVQPMASLICVQHTCQWDAYWELALAA
jgi:hypothetical protein